MQNFVSERSKVIREFFKLDEKIELINADAIPGKQKPDVEAYLSAFNMEWHLIPSADALPFDQRYIDSLYPTSCISSGKHGRQCDDLRLALKNGHTKHQGRMIAVEVTQKPGYLPENRQFYGTRYGFEPTADPFSRYLGRASFVNGTRFAIPETKATVGIRLLAIAKATCHQLARIYFVWAFPTSQMWSFQLSLCGLYLRPEKLL